LDAPGETSAILAAIRAARDPDFRTSLKGMSNPYGDGTVSEKIAQVLTSVSLVDCRSEFVSARSDGSDRLCRSISIAVVRAEIDGGQ
jgi:hypothetical protein